MAYTATSWTSPRFPGSWSIWAQPFTMTCTPTDAARPLVPSVYVEREAYGEVCILQTACGIWEPSPANQIAHFLHTYADATFWLDLMQTNPLFVRSAGRIVGMISTTFALDAHVAKHLALDWGIDPAMQTCHQITRAV